MVHTANKPKRDLRNATSLQDIRFSDLDANGDGVISEEELQQISHLVSIEQIDMNADQRVSREEFHAVRSGLISRENVETYRGYVIEERERSPELGEAEVRERVEDRIRDERGGGAPVREPEKDKGEKDQGEAEL